MSQTAPSLPEAPAFADREAADGESIERHRAQIVRTLAA